jgi:hypothetical protein
MPSRGGRPLLLRLGMLMTSTRLGMAGSNSRMVRTGDTSLREEGCCLAYMYRGISFQLYHIVYEGDVSYAIS